MIRRDRVIVVAVALLMAAGCAATPGSFVCEHCACYRDTPSTRRPVRCDTIGKEAECCVILPSS